MTWQPKACKVLSAGLEPMVGHDGTNSRIGVAAAMEVSQVEKSAARGRRLYLPGSTGCLLGRGTERQLPLSQADG